jgi:RNA polymerase sigma-70 factor (ECF subfamily)
MPVSDPAAFGTPIDDESRLIGLPRAAAVADFPEVYDRYLNFVWSCARRMGVRENELDDVVQEIFIVIHGRLETLQQPDSLRSWIYGIIRRTVSTYHRSRRTKVASAAAISAEPEMQYPQQPSPLDLAEQSDDVKLLWSLLEKLDPPKREVFVLAEIDEMTAPEIAGAIEVPLNTVYSRLRAARLEIEAALARYQAQTGRGGRS